MMSTFSRVSGNLEGDDAIGDNGGDDDDDPTMSTSSFQNLPVDTSNLPADTSVSQPSDSLTSTVTNGIADESVAASDGKVIMF